MKHRRIWIVMASLVLALVANAGFGEGVGEQDTPELSRQVVSVVGKLSEALLTTISLNVANGGAQPGVDTQLLQKMEAVEQALKELTTAVEGLQDQADIGLFLQIVNMVLPYVPYVLSGIIGGLVARIGRRRRNREGPG